MALILRSRAAMIFATRSESAFHLVEWSLIAQPPAHWHEAGLLVIPCGVDMSPVLAGSRIYRIIVITRFLRLARSFKSYPQR